MMLVSQSIMSISAIWLDISDLKLAKGTLWIAFKHQFKFTSPCPSWRVFTNLLKAFTLLWFLLLPALRHNAFSCSTHCTLRSKTRTVLNLLYLKFLLMCSLTNSLQHKLWGGKEDKVYLCAFSPHCNDLENIWKLLQIPTQMVSNKVSTWNRNGQNPLRSWEYIAKTSQLCPQLPLISSTTEHLNSPGFRRVWMK